MANDVDTAERELSGSTDGGTDAPQTDGDRQPDADVGDGDDSDTSTDASPRRPPPSGLRLALIVGLVTVVALGGVIGWLSHRAYQSRQTEKQWNMFVEVGKQGALNLTTINWQQADSDVQRILDSSTGSFHDDFATRAPMFIEVVKQAKSITQGTVTEVGLESEDGDQAQVLAAVTVKESNGGAPEDQPKMWRMRIGVQKVGDGAKVSNVQFVP
jgi:Mce-associated membrane protein